MSDPAHNVRAAFRYVTLALLEWQSPPELTRRRDYRWLEGLSVTERVVYRPYDPQGEVEPYDVDADWRERA